MFETTQAIVIEKPRHAVVREIPLPAVDDESVVIRTTFSAISTGTEVKVWNGKTGKLGGELWYPTVPGYEQVGVVEWVGPKAKPTVDGKTLQVGDRVMANEIRQYPTPLCASWGGQVAISVKNPTISGSPFDWPAVIPDGVSDQQAVAAYLAAVAHKGIEKVGIHPGETVLVIGMGAVGFSAAQLARYYGCERLIVMDCSQWRLDRARPFADDAIHAHAGHDSAIDALADLTGGRMADVVIEASGDSHAVNNVRRLVREGGWDLDDDGGRLHLQGDYPEPICLTPYQEWFNRNLRVSMSCAILPGGKEKLLGLIAEGSFNADVLYDKTVPLSDAPGEYAELERDRHSRMKTLIDWGDGVAAL
jgi:2-desacetyl-2-hydroxyethyl bacteriochlorophyllide A dehydrogenase